MLWLIYLIEASVIPLAVYFWVSYRKIKISYCISSWAWLRVNVAVFCFTLLLMLECTQFFLEINVTQMQGNGMAVVFVQQGGSVIFVMLLSGLVNRLLIQSENLDYTKGYSPVYCKIHYSLMCLACAYVCYLDGKMLECPVTSNPLYGQAMMWFVVFVQIWIGFGIFSKRRSEKRRLLDIIVEGIGKIREAYPCLLSMVIGPCILWILIHFFVNKGITIPTWTDEFLRICLFGLIVFTVTIVFILVYREPCRRYDKFRTRKKIKSLKNGNCKNGYYSSLKYKISRVGDKYEVTIEGLDIVIDENNKIGKMEKNGVRKLNEKSRKTFEMDSEKVLEYLDDKAKDRKKILGNAFESVRKFYIKQN